MNKKLIGFYDYTVILTYIGLASSVLGIFYAVKSRFILAIAYMGISLFCDTFDGLVARHKSNRTEKEMLFGIQIDSLCDIVSFGVFPVVLFYNCGVNTKADFFIIILYCLCCVIRLGYFNVLAMDDSQEKGVYHGLPVVTMAIFIPLAFLMRKLWITAKAFVWLLRGMMLIFSMLYVWNFEFRKPKLLMLGMIFPIFLVPVLLIFLL